MPPGRYPYRIVHQTISVGTDASGDPEETAVDGVTVSASIEEGAGREFREADQISGHALRTLRMRYRAGFKTGEQFRIGTRILNILEIKNVGVRNRELVILCKEVVSG